jgi:LEA14-like dessication related protein
VLPDTVPHCVQAEQTVKIGLPWLLSLMFGLTLLSGCAGITPNFDPPKVDLVSIRNLHTQDEAPKFEIKLRVTNPNKHPLDIAGISYSIAFVGKEVITGVANDITPIEGYGEGMITLEAALKVLELLRLVASLGTSNSEPLVYQFTAKIDFNGFVPTQWVEESGEISLN